MKKFFLILVLISSIFSCNRENKIKENVISQVKIKMPDPDSFELVSFEINKEINFREAKKDLSLTYCAFRTNLLLICLNFC